MCALLFSILCFAFNKVSLILAVNIVHAVWALYSENYKQNHAKPWHVTHVGRITYTISLKAIISGDRSAENKRHAGFFLFFFFFTILDMQSSKRNIAD